MQKNKDHLIVSLMMSYNKTITLTTETIFRRLKSRPHALNSSMKCGHYYMEQT